MIDECLPFTTAKSEPFLYLSACCTLYYPPQRPFLFSSLLYVLFSQGGLILPMEPNGYMKEETKRMNGGGGGVAESELDPWTAWAYKPRTISLLLIGACLLMWLPLSLLCFSSPLCVTHNPHVCLFFCFLNWVSWASGALDPESTTSEDIVTSVKRFSFSMLLFLFSFESIITYSILCFLLLGECGLWLLSFLLTLCSRLLQRNHLIYFLLLPLVLPLSLTKLVAVMQGFNQATSCYLALSSWISRHLLSFTYFFALPGSLFSSLSMPVIIVALLCSWF